MYIVCGYTDTTNITYKVLSYYDLNIQIHFLNILTWKIVDMICFASTVTLITNRMMFICKTRHLLCLVSTFQIRHWSFRTQLFYEYHSWSSGEVSGISVKLRLWLVCKICAAMTAYHLIIAITTAEHVCLDMPLTSNTFL